MSDGITSSAAPSIEPLPGDDTPVHEKWRVLCARISEVQSLRQKHSYLVEQSAIRNESHQSLTEELITVERHHTNQAEQVELQEREVLEAEAMLAQVREKLSVEQNLLVSITERKTKIQKTAQRLSQEKEEQLNLEIQLAATEIEATQLGQQLQNTVDEFCRPPPPKPSPSADTVLREASYVLVSDLPASRSVSTTYPAAGRKNEYDIEISEDEDDGTIEAELSYDPGAAEDSDYIEPRPSSSSRNALNSSSKVKSPRRRQCHRCKERGFRCERTVGDSSRFCVRCRLDDIACSYRRVSKGQYRGRQPNEIMNARLKELHEVQKLSFQQIRERRIFEDTSLSALRVRYTRLKNKEAEAGRKTDTSAVPGQEPQEPSIAT